MRRIKLEDESSALQEAFASIASDSDIAIIQQDGGPDLVVITLDHFKGLRETAYLLSSPGNAERLAHSLSQASAGEVVERELIEIGESDARSPLLK